MDVSSAQMERLADIAQRYGIDLILAFGSIVAGGVHKSSDLDLAVRFERPPPYDWKMLGTLLCDLQEVFPGPEVDLATLNVADPLFLKQIAESAQLLCGTSTALAEFKILAYKRYVDHRPFLRLESEYVRRQLAQRQDPA